VICGNGNPENDLKLSLAHVVLLVSSVHVVVGIGLCSVNELVCDLRLRGRRWFSLKAHCQKSILSHTCHGRYLEDTKVT